MKFFRLLAALYAAAFAIAANAQEWKPVGNHIMTEWGENLDPMHVHQEYPRPQMIRDQWQNLNGLWNYAITEASAEGFDLSHGQILVPFAIESALSGVGRHVTDKEALWYEREFTIPSEWKNKRILLHFGAVDWHAAVYVDDNFAGEHKGGYAPFSFDITDLMARGRKHILKVKVLDATDKSWQPRGKQVSRPEGIWYTPVTGIWQTVWLEPVAETYVKSYLAVPDIDKSEVKVTVDAQLKEGEICKVALLQDGKVVATGDGLETVLKVPEMKLWSPESPALYDINITIASKGKAVDNVKGYTAMRKISHAKDESGFYRTYLNNQPIFQFGTLDQGWWPDGLYTAPCDEALMFDIVKTKEMGFNMIRKHVKVEPARWYWHCDRLGMLVWQDMPNTYDNSMISWNYYGFDLVNENAMTSLEGKKNFYREWEEIIRTKMNFPCIVTWVPFNEAWGQFDTKDVVAFTEAIDDTRLIDYASGGNFYTDCGGEIHDIHNYPDPVLYLLDQDRVTVLGEYGGIGYPVEGHLWKTDSNWGYIEFQNADDVLQTYEKYAQMVSELVGFGLSGAIYTQITDVEGEVNGLITYDRKVVKMDIGRLYDINTAVINALK